ncbi:MAG: O-antigen ligase family protein [Chloroflexi bacterium]|nr:O-antigen ligase family protein [Chloroflexota bacterium]
MIGYVIFGRAVSYLGIPPIYVGEVALLFGLVYVGAHFEWRKLLKIGITKWLLLFMAWCAVRTIPYLSHFGKDALRDGAIWGYGFFSIIIATLVIRRNLFVPIIKWYRDLSVIFAVWIPFAMIYMFFFSDRIPLLPWGPFSNIPLISLKGGDLGVHIAGIFSFYYLILPNYPFRKSLLLFWISWVFCILFIGITGRAAFLTVSLTTIITLYQRSHESWAKWIAVILILFSLFLIFEVEIDTGQERIISYDQLITNVKSIFGDVEGYSGEGSKIWRIMWWQKIIDYTLFVEYFWTGKVFGINLADDDGFQVLDENALRSPHNGHLTILARAGVPGFILWLILQISFFFSLWKSHRRLIRQGYFLDSLLYVWVAIYWLAFMINGSFDVFFEGPQGGIWLWSLIGFGLALIYAERNNTDVVTKTSIEADILQ